MKRAIDTGMRQIGVSSHAPVPYPTTWNMKQEKLPEYLELIENLKIKYKDNLELLTSLEVDYIPDLAGPDHELIKAANLDYTVGSVHFVDTFPDGSPFSIDDSTEDFSTGIHQIFGGDIRRTIKRYFDLQREMLEHQPPHILGHMDKIRMHNRNRFFFEEDATWYQQEVYETLKLAAEKNVVVEINTKYFEKAGITFPSANHFQWMARNKIPITLSSDAHVPENLVAGFSEVSKQLKESGFQRLFQYQKNGFTAHEFQTDGINWDFME